MTPKNYSIAEMLKLLQQQCIALNISVVLGHYRTKHSTMIATYIVNQQKKIPSGIMFGEGAKKSPDKTIRAVANL